MLKNRVVAVLMAVLAAALHFWANSALSLSLLVVTLAVPTVLFAQVRLAAAVTRLELDVDASLRLGESHAARLRLVQGLPFCAVVAFVHVRVTNTVFCTKTDHEFEAALSWRNRTLDLPVFAERYGRVIVEAQGVRLSDPLGLFAARIPLDVYRECVVLPEQARIEALLDQTPSACTFGDTYDAVRSGNDVGEVFDVREYLPGDSMASIHWKLSSKFNEMIAREFSRPADYDVALIACASREGSDVSCNGVASVALSLSEALLRAGVFHDAGVLRDDALEFTFVNDIFSCTTYSEDVLSTPLPESSRHVGHAVSSASLAGRFTKVVLVTNFHDESLWTDLSQVADTTVVLIAGDGSRASSALNGRYGLYTLQARGLADHEHHITL